MIWGQALLIFVFSVFNDWFAIQWHKAREENDPVMGAVWGVTLGLIGWLAFKWVLHDAFWLMLPDLLGTAVGSYFGIKHHHAPLPFLAILGLAGPPELEDDEGHE
jgi:hypothetical protein